MENKITINFIIPIGKDCKIGKFLKANDLKKTSYPFDWLFTEADQTIIPIILHDNFKDFLNTDFHYTISEKTSGHKLYDTNFAMFRHHNILDENSLNYYKRCVNRFLEIHKIDSPKLYIIDIDELENIVKVIEYINKVSNNFHIFVISKNKKYEKELSKENVHVGHFGFLRDLYHFDLIEDTNLIINERSKGHDRFDRCEK